MAVENEIWHHSINGIGKISLVWFGATLHASTKFKWVAPADEATDRPLLPVSACKFISNAWFSQRHGGDTNGDGVRGIAIESHMFLSHRTP